MPSTPPWETDAARALIARVAPDTHDPQGAWLAAVREALTGRTVAPRPAPPNARVTPPKRKGDPREDSLAGRAA